MEPGIDGIAGGYLAPAYRGSARSGGSNVLTSGRPAGQIGASALVSARQHDEATVRGHWPLRSHIALGALPGAVPSARLHARLVLWEWGQKSLTEDAELIVSELTTNAVTATQVIDSLQPVRLWLLSDGSRTLILIGDASSHPPRRADPDESEADGGRGLLLVEGLSCNWGWYFLHRIDVSKVVWAELRMPSVAGQAEDVRSDADR
jgi:anti-sigma regulatory factor (Ser/Thr protein kinase)